MDFVWEHFFFTKKHISPETINLALSYKLDHSSSATTIKEKSYMPWEYLENDGLANDRLHFDMKMISEDTPMAMKQTKSFNGKKFH